MVFWVERAGRDGVLSPLVDRPRRQTPVGPESRPPPIAGGISWPALNQTVCALRFLYGVTLRQADLPERIPYARTPRKLPVVLGADEVVCFLEAVPSLKARAALTTAYAAGRRASEAASIKVADIDSSRMVIRVEQCRGRSKSRPLQRRRIWLRTPTIQRPRSRYPVEQ